MEYVNLGNTGLKVSRICLGMMTYGTSNWRDWVLDEVMRARLYAARWNSASTSLIPLICILRGLAKK